MATTQTKSAKPNIFERAKPIQAVAKSAKSDKDEVQIAGLERLAQLTALKNTIDSLITATRLGVDTQMVEHFTKVGMIRKEKPDNFRGLEGVASASMELRKRSTASGLTEQEVELAEKYKIPTTVVQDRPETYVFNQSYLGDPKIMEAAAKALEAAKLPDDMIQFQQATKKVVTTDDSLDAVFKLKDSDEVRSLLKTFGVLAVKPKLDTIELAKAVNDLGVIIATGGEE